ncbi:MULTISPECIES: sensor histidine kinase [unclassified Paenibacillus]|uniref:sensor histidine kinase n=1 Tax=unclassified Paenibacillus TaxID=185978 RepID=UPI0009554601|nr:MULTISPECIES: sensor histidine kinase [unclassified Paenibacillus]SIQ88587.1 two-component system, sensor histidine kinase YesM [Paenibacillus sp. RU4X]SIR09545.1 two-component system, sensor histidine kinase YesM [Paenibacillus sp. RU4T]
MRQVITQIGFRFNNLRLKSQLFIAFLIVVLIPVLIVGIFLTAQYRNNVLEQATRQTTNNVDKIVTQTADILRIPMELSDDYMVSTELSNLVNTRYATVFDSTHALWEFNDFRSAVKLYREVDYIRLYADNATLLENWEFLHLTDAVRGTDWYRAANAKDGIHWMYTANETRKGQKSLSLVRRIPFPTYKTSGVLVIDVNPKLFDTMLRQEPYDTMIVDASDTVAAAKNGSWIGKSLSQLEFPGLAGKAEGTYNMTFGGEEYRVVIEKLNPASSVNGLRIVSVFAVESIVGEANRVARLGMGVLAVSMAIALVLIYIVASVLTKRTLVLYRNLSRVGKGDLQVYSDIQGNDEIGLLSRQFNNMVASIRGLMAEVEDSHRQRTELEVRQRDIKLKMMASQINPHFLFNALESIRMRIHMKGEKEIASVVRMLGRLIRNNIEIGQRHIPLGEELEIVRYYLEIQKFRYGEDRLEFVIDVEEDMSLTLIPPLILQPLVENAVVHGLEGIGEGGRISIAGKRLQDGGLELTVADNGVGMTPERLRDNRDALDDPSEDKQHRIGLRNVHQRLVLNYGPGSGLRLESRDGEGTEIRLLIPRMKEE